MVNSLEHKIKVHKLKALLRRKHLKIGRHLYKLDKHEDKYASFIELPENLFIKGSLSDFKEQWGARETVLKGRINKCKSKIESGRAKYQEIKDELERTDQ